MTHVQKIWTSKEVLERCKDLSPQQLKSLREWMRSPGQEHLPEYVSDEQLLLFLHSCYSDMDATKKCIEEYYRLRLRYPNFFENRDVDSKELEAALRILDYGILPVKTPQGYQIVYHRLNDTDPHKYNFCDGFKLLVMMMDVVYAKNGPQPGLVLLFDLRGVKLGHITRVPLMGVKRGMEYLQEAIPVRLQAIHVLNTHPIMDKIMLLIRPFMKKSFMNLIHFHKENDETVFDTFPKSCLPVDYGGEIESIRELHEKFIKEMKQERHMFVEEEKLMFGNKSSTNKKKCDQATISLAKLEID